MQLKNVWNNAVLPAKLWLVYNRFTLSRTAIAYFALTLVHCIIQIALQVRGHAIDVTQSRTLSNVIELGNATEKFAILDSHDSIVLCHAIPGETPDPHPCKIFPGPEMSSLDISMSMEGLENLSKRNPPGEDAYHNTRMTFDRRTMQPIIDASKLPSGSPGVVEVDKTCSQVLAWPSQIVSQAKRESVATVAFQIWLFSISIVAILTESIPHVVAALVTHILSTAWAAFQIARIQYVEERYQDLVVNLACHHVDFMPTYWQDTQNTRIPILVLNVVSLVLSSFLSRKLYKQFGAQTFARVGGSRRIHNLYLLVLVLSVNLQLTTFFLVASLVLWVEQLYNGPFAGVLSGHQSIYLGGLIFTVIFILPWLYTGWTAVRREQRRTMHIFFLISLLFIASQSAIFFCPIYRVTFSTWSFFGTLTVMVYILLTITFLMAIVCRYFFGRGLAHFLQVQDVLEECNFTPVYIERDSFVSVRKTAKRGDNEAGDDAETMPWDVEGKGAMKKVNVQYQRNIHDKEALPPTPTHSPPVGMLSRLASQATRRLSNSQSTLRSQVVFSEDDDDALRHQHDGDTPTSPSSEGHDHKSFPPGLILNNKTDLSHGGGVNMEPFPASSPSRPSPGNTRSLPLVANAGLPSDATPIQVPIPKLAITIPDTRRVSY